MSCPLREAARDAPEKTALLLQKGAYTFAELDRLADRLAERLVRSGIEAGSRVAVRLPNHWDLIPLLFAVWRLGAAICPLSLRFPPDQVSECISRLAPALFIDSMEEFPKAKKQLDTCEAALFLFTSGSTGWPKIAALSLQSLIANAEGAAFAFGLRPDDQWLLSLPLYHVGGIGIVLRCVLSRAAIVLDEKSFGITHLSYVPTQLYRATPIYPKLRCLLLSGAPIPAFSSSLPIYPSYGLTEMGSAVASPHVLPGREVKIAADGEILVRGPCLFQGYWNGRLELPIDREGWFATGDLGQLCAKNQLSVSGRKDWQFISGGENIQPEEIERELSALPEVLESVVVPIPDPEFGARPAAVVKTCSPSFDLKQMQTYLARKLPKYKIPIALVVLDEIPRSGLKIDRKKVFEIASRKAFK